jgi:peptide/nickel transport system permease protein
MSMNRELVAHSAERVGFFRAFVESPWTRFLARRLLGLVGVLIALVVFVFLLVRLVPGDAAINLLGQSAAPGAVERVNHQLGLDRSLWSQFGSYVGDLSRGDLGTDFATNEPVADTIRNRISSSVTLAGISLAVVLLLAVPIGLLAGAFTREGRHRRIEVGFMGVTSVAGAVPEYLTATVLTFIFVIELGVLPITGSGIAPLVLPVTALSIGPVMILSRIVRIETLNVLAQDYMRTARGKRLPSPRIFFRHVLPNVLTATLTVAGLLFAGLIGGAVIVETVFNRAGIGTALVGAVIGNNYPVVQGITLVLGATVVVVNILVDLLLAVLDPRSLARRS